MNSGNKARKLEYVLYDLLHQFDDTKETILVTEGGIQSNHCVQVAAAAARLGLRAILLLHKGGGWDPSTVTEDEFESLGNVQLLRLLGADIRIVPSGYRKDLVLEEVTNQGCHGAWIPSGGSTHPAGGLGYVNWAFELESQEKSLHPQLPDSGIFDYIIVACQSGSTLGGMIAGFKYLAKQAGAQQRRRIIGVFASPTSVDAQQSLVLGIAQKAASRLGMDESEIALSDVVIDGRFHCGAYGVTDQITRSNMALLARSEGIATDPVYTGKAISALCEMVKAKELRSTTHLNTNVLFVHTGGHGAISAYRGFEAVG
jgi:1-aminocyclopropane-1-carboxylate deaminase